MTVEISETPRPAVPDRDIDVEAIAAFAADTLRREGVGDDARLSIAFIDVDEMARLNAEFMGKDGPTDVLSFPIEDASPGQPPAAVPDGPPLMLGDILISADVVAAHADEFGVSFEDELYLMVCHGVLHILGWDHQTDDDERHMEAREAEHLATVGRMRR
jgi:probable rRNA maturation factor